MKICSIEGCDKKVVALGYCERHYRRFRKYGNALEPLKMQKYTEDSVCSVGGAECSGRLILGMCSKHYQRLVKYDDANYVQTIVGDDEARWNSKWTRTNKVIIEGVGCSEFTGWLDKDGYGLIWIEGTKKKTHRHAYERAYGPVPEGMQVQHKCHNPPCGEPVHLKVGYAKENYADMVEAGRQKRPVGERNGMAKLTWAKVDKIRLLWSSGKYTKTFLAYWFNVSTAAIYAIINNKRWVIAQEV